MRASAAVLLLLVVLSPLCQAERDGAGGESDKEWERALAVQWNEHQGSPSEGYVTLHWEATGTLPDNAVYELQQIRRERGPAERVIYSGRDQASLVSGLPEGKHHYRLRAVVPDGRAGPWSTTKVVDVSYPIDFATVKMLLVLGLVMLSVVIAIIVGGALRTRREQEQGGSPHG